LDGAADSMKIHVQANQEAGRGIARRPGIAALYCGAPLERPFDSRAAASSHFGMELTALENTRKRLKQASEKYRATCLAPIKRYVYRQNHPKNRVRLKSRWRMFEGRIIHDAVFSHFPRRLERLRPVPAVIEDVSDDRRRARRSGLKPPCIHS